MGIQKTVGLYPAVALEGQLASVGEAHYTANTKVSKKEIHVGRFCFYGASAEANDYVTQTAAGQRVCGIVIRTQTYVAAGFKPSLIVAAYQPLTIAVEGAVWVKCANDSETPKVGDKVFARDTDGAVQTHATTVSSAQPTNWYVTRVLEDDSKSMIQISNLVSTADAAA